VTTRLDDVTTVVLAPNPSPLTLDGTNTYLLGAPQAGEVIVVDPGPALPAHRAALDDALVGLGSSVAAVVVTHHHADHAAAASWAGDWRAPLFAFDPVLVRGAGVMADDANLRRAGLTLTALHTPGHASDHLCLQVSETGVVLTGDHVLGRGTTVVAWPDGDMAAYMASLRRLAAVNATALYPGHGPPLHDPHATIVEYLAHRADRETQILAAVEVGDATPAQIVARVYADVPKVLHPAAERSVRAHLAKLIDDGRLPPHYLPADESR
jgi:glyoxylase-like metal-dependent hydrolase (beta-lactamase superfamily II)